MVLIEWFIGGGLLAIVVFVLKSAYDQNSKIGRIYGRFDEYKNHFESRYQNKDVCTILHSQIQGDITEIKSDVKLLLRKSGG